MILKDEMCLNCYWNDGCDPTETQTCDNWTPIDESDDVCVGEIVERGRQQYREEYFLMEDNDWDNDNEQ